MKEKDGDKSQENNKDSMVIGLSIIAIIVLAVLVVNIDKIFPPPEMPDPMEYAGKSLSAATTGNIAVENPDAEVTIIEFSDFKCPWCKTASETVEKIVAEYGDKIHFDFRHMAGHPGSQILAEAVECAKAQGKFWEYHHILFSRGMFTDSDLMDYAASLDMDVQRFEECLTNGEMALKVENDLKEALQMGITGTPTFVINGKIYPGALEYERFKGLIESELAG